MAEECSATVVKAILAAWSQGDSEAVADLFAQDGIFHCVMRQPIVGRDAFHRHLQALQSFKPGNKVEIQVRHIAEAGGVVFTERLDKVCINGREGEIPAVGVFEVRDGKVMHWREYFDMATMARERGENSS